MNRLGKYKFLSLFLLSAASPFVQSATSDYDLAKVDKHPIPREIHFQLWQEIALKQCDKAWKNHNTSPENCRQIVSTRGPECEQKQALSTPETISSKSQSKEIGRAYLQCTLPYAFCKDIEVRTEQEARERCR